MPRKRKASRLFRRPGPPPPTPQEWFDLVLGAGIGAFVTDADRRRAWALHRDELIGATNEMTRPQAFWDYDAPHVPPEDHEAYLIRENLLTEQEHRYLVRKRAEQQRRQNREDQTAKISKTI